MSARQIYGGTFGLFNEILPRTGVDVSFVDVTDLDAVAAAFRDNDARAVLRDDREPFASGRRRRRTRRRSRTIEARRWSSTRRSRRPISSRRVEHGVDLVVHSATKYLGGHSDVTAGVVSGTAEAIARIRHLGIDYGGCLAPLEAWLTIRGVQTLALRMDRICSNAMAVAKALEGLPSVERVHVSGARVSSAARARREAVPERLRRDAHLRGFGRHPGRDGACSSACGWRRRRRRSAARRR